MRKRSSIMMLIVSALVCHDSSIAQWKKTSSPEILVPLSTQAVAVQGDMVLVGTFQNTIFRSTDGGITWAKADSGLSPSLYWTFSFFINNDTVFAGTSDGVYRSTDLGESWELMNDGLHIVWAGGVYCFLQKGDTLLAGTDDGVYYTTNEGANWLPDTVGLPVIEGGDPINSLASSSRGYIFAGTNDGIYRSSDGGGHWKAINSGIPIWWASYHAGVEGILIDSGRIHIVTNGWGIYRSTDEGNTWVPETTGIDLQSNGHFYPMTSTIKDGGIIYVGTQDEGVYESSDGGDSWAKINAGFPLNSYVHSLAVNGTSLLAADQEGLFVKRSDNAAWAPVLTEFPGKVDFESIGGSGRNLIVDAYSDYGGGTAYGTYLTSDGGNSWVADTNLKMSYPLFQTIGTDIYAMGSGLFVSSDQGLSWLEIDSGLTGPVNGIASKSQELFAATEYGGVYASTTDGQSWTVAGLEDSFPQTLIVNNGDVFAGGFATVYRSTDNGLTWATVDNGLPLQQWVLEMVSAEGIIYAGTYAGVYRSTNGGENWIAINAGLRFDSLGSIGHLILLSYGNEVIAGTGNGIYLIADNGSTWISSDSGLSSAAFQIESLTVLGGDLYAGTANGLWHRPVSEILSTRSNMSPSPKIFGLAQNYPNPFNPTTTINYTLPQKSLVRIEVFNVLGEGVTTLVNKVEQAGTHSAKFDGSALPSGVYLYRIIAGNYVLTKKMLLLK